MTDHQGRVRTAPSDKRVRIILGGEVIVDTDDALYVWENPHYPQYYVPLADVDRRCARPDGDDEALAESRDGVALHRSAAGGREARRRGVGATSTARSTSCAIGSASSSTPWMPGSRRTRRSSSTPAARRRASRSCPARATSSSRVDGIVVAESDRPTFLHETGLRRRTYLPKLDVRMDLLVPTSTTSRCPYKGTAVYWSLVTPTAEHTDLAWSYPSPLRESAPIAGLLAFYDERVTLTVEGVGPPRT